MFEDVLRMIVLGVVQGLTEFLPISSSGHLIITRELFGWEFSDDLTFDVALHLGTTVALVAFFWREWLEMGRSAWRQAVDRGRRPDPDSTYGVRLLLLLAAGSVPAAVAGLLFNDIVEEEVRSPLVVGSMLVVFGVVLLWAEQAGKRERGIEDAGWLDSVLIGCAQAIALVPGVSRSGATITAGLFRGLTREAAARFSFLLSTPIVLGAGALKMGEAFAGGLTSQDVWLMTVGAAVAAATGWAAIYYLLRLIQTYSYVPFVIYRIGMGGFVLVYFAV